MAQFDIPLVNLQRQYEEIRSAVHDAIDAVLRETAFVKGPFVESFEQKFSAAYGGIGVAGCSNGTSAISIALEALGVGRGDEVLVPTHTFIATAEAVCHVGATPIFVDCDPATYCIDPAACEAALTDKTRAILPVHIYGNAADMTALMDLAQKHGLVVIEDCAQAHLATLAGRTLGTFGHAGSFSFYPGKNLGAYGDAGAIIAHDEVALTRMRKLIDHGRLSKYEHDIVGYNQRMDGLQGAVLGVKLDYLQQWTAQRRAVAKRYDTCVDALGLKRIQSLPDAQPVYHLYVIEVDKRDSFQQQLGQAGIATGIHYPLPLHLQPAFAANGYRRGQFPVTEEFCKRIVSIPVCGSISDEEVEYICEQVTAAVS